jgi:hypothetical protein
LPVTDGQEHAMHDDDCRCDCPHCSDADCDGDECSCTVCRDWAGEPANDQFATAYIDGAGEVCS